MLGTFISYPVFKHQDGGFEKSTWATSMIFTIANTLVLWLAMGAIAIVKAESMGACSYMGWP